MKAITRLASVGQLSAVEERIFDRYDLEVDVHISAPDRVEHAVRVLQCGSGPPLVLVPGASPSAAAFAPLIASLPGRTCLAVEGPGWDREAGLDYTSVDLRAHAVLFLDSVFDSLGIERAPILGTSMGGLWSTWFALDRCERVSSLTFVGCPALLLDTGVPASIRFGGSALRILRQNLRTSSEVSSLFIEAEQGGSFSSSLPSLVERVVHDLASGVLPPVDAQVLAAITQPSMFIWGNREVCGSPTIATLACEVMRDARLEVVDGGHLVWLEDPERCGELVASFLALQGTET